MWDIFVGFMINVLLYIYNLVGQNFGIAIILFTPSDPSGHPSVNCEAD